MKIRRYSQQERQNVVENGEGEGKNDSSVLSLESGCIVAPATDDHRRKKGTWKRMSKRSPVLSPVGHSAINRQIYTLLEVGREVWAKDRDSGVVEMMMVAEGLQSHPGPSTFPTPLLLMPPGCAWPPKSMKDRTL